MRNVFIFFAFLIAGMAHAQIITNVDKLRIRDVEQGVENDKILVIDSGNVVRWIDAIEVDLSDYYTISEVDAFVADLEAGLLERYTKDEVDALLDGLELRLDDYYTKAEANDRFALRTRTISAGNGLTGGGNLTANRTIGLSTDTQEDIAKGVEAHGWGDFRDYGLGLINTETILNQANQHSSLENSWFRVSSFANSDFMAAGTGISLSYSGQINNQLFIAHGGNRKGIWYRSKVLGESEFETPIRVWDDLNLPNPATESWVNSQGFIKDLSNYYTKNESLNQFVRLSGVQDIADTKTFTSSPVVPNPTLDAHAVNKEYVDSRVKFARYRWTNPVKFEGIINFPTEVFNSNLDTERTNNNERIYVEDGYYNVNVTLEFEQNGNSYVEIHMNAIRIASNAGDNVVGTTVSTGVIYIGENDYISVLVNTDQNTINLIAEISFEKIK